MLDLRRMTRWRFRNELERTESGGHTTEARLGIHRGQKKLKTAEGAPAGVDDERSETALVQKNRNKRQRKLYNDTKNIRIKIYKGEDVGITNYKNGG